jgi:hypothetical protein
LAGSTPLAANTSRENSEGTHTSFMALHLGHGGHQSSVTSQRSSTGSQWPAGAQWPAGQPGAPLRQRRPWGLHRPLGEPAAMPVATQQAEPGAPTWARRPLAGGRSRTWCAPPGTRSRGRARQAGRARPPRRHPPSL